MTCEPEIVPQNATEFLKFLFLFLKINPNAVVDLLHETHVQFEFAT